MPALGLDRHRTPDPGTRERLRPVGGGPSCGGGDLGWERSGKGGRPNYDVMEPGFKYNLPDLMAAIGLVQLKRLPEINGRRASLAAAYHKALAGVRGLDLPPEVGAPHRHGWHLFIVKVTGMERDAFIAGLQEYNVGAGLHFPACHLLSYARERYGYKRGDLPACEKAADRVVSLPLFPAMTEQDVEYVAQAARTVLGEI